MCVSRHHQSLRFGGAVQQGFQQIAQQGAQVVYGIPDEQAQVSGDLFIAAASAVQLLPGFADERYQLFLYKVMNVFSFWIIEVSGLLLTGLADLVQRRGDQTEFRRRNNARGFQSLRVCAAGRKFVAQQFLVEGKRPLPLFEMRIQRLPEPA
jgi:hypothetical protein